jgi:hypothetical protein
VKDNQPETKEALKAAFCEENIAEGKLVSVKTPAEKRGIALKDDSIILI